VRRNSLLSPPVRNSFAVFAPHSKPQRWLSALPLLAGLRRNRPSAASPLLSALLGLR